jgi:hypothetical protein
LIFDWSRPSPTVTSDAALVVNAGQLAAHWSLHVGAAWPSSGVNMYRVLPVPSVMNVPSAPVVSLSWIAPPEAAEAEADADSDADADGAASDAEADGAAADGAVVAAPPPLLEHAATIAVTANAASSSFDGRVSDVIASSP